MGTQSFFNKIPGIGIFDNIMNHTPGHNFIENLPGARSTGLGAQAYGAGHPVQAINNGGMTYAGAPFGSTGPSLAGANAGYNVNPYAAQAAAAAAKNVPPPGSSSIF